MKLEFILMIAIIGAIVFIMACTPSKKTETAEVTEEAAEEVEQAVEIIEKDANVGGACTYNDIQGMATITYINQANLGEVVIKFDFTASEDVEYKYANFPDKGQKFFVKGQGCCPPASWCKENGISQGAKIKCVRQELTDGSCTPVVFAFPQFEKNGWN